MPPRRPTKPIPVPARIVRRTDAAGRPYYVRVEDGRRMSKDAYRLERARRAAQRAQIQRIIDRRQEAKRPKRARGKFLKNRPPLAPLSQAPPLDVGRPPTAPFPPGVGPTGAPEGFYEDDIPWFTIPDEDEYDEK